ncbi:hypothetical protein D9613_010725 [Agrocybe pediades]|uniref:Uncharacterized protein n=1 Tax=Agrocybe pediades TaxID=84607 RepID=A0A8H4QKR3_9AGAR|nr:hypothetical protein D9613_010725 [Agrocybe pediades]
MTGTSAILAGTAFVIATSLVGLAAYGVLWGTKTDLGVDDVPASFRFAHAIDFLYDLSEPAILNTSRSRDGGRDSFCVKSCPSHLPIILSFNYSSSNLAYTDNRNQNRHEKRSKSDEARGLSILVCGRSATTKPEEEAKVWIEGRSTDRDRIEKSVRHRFTSSSGM